MQNLKPLSEINFIERIALFYYTKIDRTGLFYKTLQSFSFTSRAVLYLLYFFTFFIICFYANKILNIEFEQYEKGFIFLYCLKTMLFLFYCALYTFIPFPLFYEYLISKSKYPIEMMLALYIQHKNNIEHKKRKFNNLNIYIRIIIYLVGYFIVAQLLYGYLIIGLMQFFNDVQFASDGFVVKTSESEHFDILFSQTINFYKNIMAYVSIIYFLTVVVFERKNKIKK